MELLKDASYLFEHGCLTYHTELPGFRINELQISPKQTTPWHSYSNVQDTFYKV